MMTEIRGFKGDIYQMMTVARYEFLKYLRGKKIFIALLLTVGVFVMVTAMPYLLDIDMGTGANDYFGLYVSNFLFILIVVLAALLSSSSLVSEFEERTALLMFTRPIKKDFFFLGKFLAGFLIAAILSVAYYVCGIIATGIATGSVTAEMFESIGILLLFVFTITSLAFMISAFVKKGSTAAIITFFLPLVSLMGYAFFTMANVDAWFDLYYNFLSIGTFLTGAVSGEVSGIMVYYPVVSQAVVLLFAYGLIMTAIALLRFRSREF